MTRRTPSGIVAATAAVYGRLSDCYEDGATGEVAALAAGVSAAARESRRTQVSCPTTGMRDEDTGGSGVEKAEADLIEHSVETARVQQRAANAADDELYRSFLRSEVAEGRVSGSVIQAAMCNLVDDAIVDSDTAQFGSACNPRTRRRQQANLRRRHDRRVARAASLNRTTSSQACRVDAVGRRATAAIVVRPGAAYDEGFPSDTMGDDLGGARACLVGTGELDRIKVGTRQGLQTPARILDLYLCAGEHRLRITRNILDSGSATMLLGLTDAEEFMRVAPNSMRRVEPLEDSIRRINGVTGSTATLYHVAFTLEIGGVLVDFEDVPVVAGHRGLLLGNDFTKGARPSIDWCECIDSAGALCDGSMVLRDAHRRVISKPVFISHRKPAVFKSPTGAETCSVHDENEGAIAGAVPIVYAPNATLVQPYSMALVRCRVPAASIEGHSILVVPLDDDRVKSLGVLVSPGIYLPDKDGYVRISVCNPHPTKAVNVPMLTPVGRFIVDPSVSQRSLEFTVDEIMEKINLPGDLSDEDRFEVKEMISTRRALFASKLGYAHGYKQNILTPSIDSGECAPPAEKNRRLGPEETAALKINVDKLLENQLIEPCRSPFNSIPVLVRKPDGSLRTVHDYRRLNALTTKDTYPLPNVEANLAALGEANLFTTADLLMGFHQCELEDDAKLKTAFGTPWGQFCYRRMPMGLTSSPGAFMRLVDSALRGLPPEIALAYCDDIIVRTAGDMKAHMKDVGLTFDRLIEAGFTVRCDKLHVGMSEVPYLGFLVGARGTRPNPSKTEALMSMAYAQFQRDPAAASRFAGMMGFYQKFLPNAHVGLAPFFELKAKGADSKSIVGSLRFRAAFVHLKQQLTDVTALSRPDYSKPFYVDVDSAATSGTGACLSQRATHDDPASHRPLAFWSRRLSDSERGYAIRDQECLGLSEALAEWRPYLQNARVIVRTDHRSLRWLLRTRHAEGSRVARWALRVQGYDVEIEWTPGVDNVAADCFSRCPDPQIDTVERSERVADELNDELQLDDPAEAALSLEPVLLALAERADSSSECERNPSPSFLAECVGATQCTFNTSAPTGTPLLGVAVAFTADVLQDPVFVSHTAMLEAQLRTDLNGWAQSLSPAVAHHRGDRPETERNRGDGGSGTCAAAQIGVRTGTAKKGVIERYSERTACLFLKPLGGGRFEMLLEQQDDYLGPPSVTVDSSSKASYRHQLGAHLQLTLPSPLAAVLNRQLRHASVHKVLRTLRTIKPDRCTHFFVTFVAADMDVTSVTSMSFVAVGPELPYLLSDASDVSISHKLLRYVRKAPEYSCWDGMTGLPAMLEEANSEAMGSKVATADTDAKECPTVRMLPRGPALVSTSTEAAFASEALHEAIGRFRANSVEFCVSLDLEGELGGPRSHVSLLQVTLSSLESRESDREAYTYVFDTHCCRNVLARGPKSLCSLLEDPGVPMIVHCCYGDTSALFYEHGVAAGGVLDSSIADCLLCARHFNRPRDLGSVIATWVEGGGALMTHKAGFVHLPRMFEERPLPQRLFEYAYEDVLFGPALYTALKSALDKRGLYELATQLSAQRCPFYSIPQSPRFPPPIRTAIALIDKDHFVCLRSLQDQFCCLPSGLLDEGSTDDAGRQARQMWTRVMGPPPKRTRADLCAAINARLRKPVRLRDTLLFIAVVDDCAAALPALQRALPLRTGSTHELAIREAMHLSSPAAGAREEQVLLFQYLHVTAELESKRIPGPHQAASILYGNTDRVGSSSEVQCLRVLDHELEGGPSEEEPATLAIHTSLLGGRQVRVATVRDEGREAPTDLSVSDDLTAYVHAAAAANGAVKAAIIRSAIIIQDQTHVYVLKGATEDAVFTLPSYAIDANDDRVAAALAAFDLYIGPAARKGGQAVGGQSKFTLCPIFGRLSTAAVRDMESIGFLGNQAYYACRYDNLLDHAAAFYAARRPINGFRLTDTLARRHIGFALLPVSEALERLPPKDAEALRLACGMEAPTADVNLTANPQSHEGEDQVQLSHQQVFDPTWPVGFDKGGDLLFEAAVFVCFGRFTGQLEDTSCGVADAFVAAPKDNDVDGIGPNPRFRMPSRPELLAAQLDHPAMGDIVHSLLSRQEGTTDFKVLCTLQPRAKQQGGVDLSFTVNRTAEPPPIGFYLDHDGVLMFQPRRSARQGLVVIPPRYQTTILMAYHDRQGHFGITKTFERIASRYHWGSHDCMRATVSDYVNGCRVCSRTKLPRHKGGEGHVVSNGEHPYHTVTMDYFETGVNADGYDGTLDFACKLARHVSSNAMQGSPAAEDVADCLVQNVVRHYGVPRVLLCDRASVFLAKGIRFLYARYGIDLRPSTAYHHRTVGLIERWHGVLRSLLLSQAIATGARAWYKYLPLLELAFNSSVNNATGFSPFYVLHGRQCTLPADSLLGTNEATWLAARDLPEWVAEHVERLGVTYDTVAQRLHLNAVHAKRHFDLKRDCVLQFAVGDQVRVIKGSVVDGVHPKAIEPTQGPYTVVKALPRGRYLLKDSQSRRTATEIHIDRLIPYPSRHTLTQNEKDGSYSIQKVLRRRTRKATPVDCARYGYQPADSVIDYRVRWLGLGSEYDEWRTAAQLNGALELVAAFNRAHSLPAEIPTDALDVVSREAAANTPHIEWESLQRPRFRAHAEKQLAVPSVLTRESTEGDVGSEALARDNGSVQAAPPDHAAPPPSEESSSTIDYSEDRFPAGSRIESHVDNAWWPGTVVRTYLRKQMPRDRCVVVQYDDHRYPRPEVHGLRDSDIRSTSVLQSPVAMDGARRNRTRSTSSDTGAQG